MQIFVSDYNPEESAQALDDKRVLKMIIESSQLLSCALYIHGISSESLPATTKWVNHPLVKWTAESGAHFHWLRNHLYHLCEEYTLRFKKKHSYNWHSAFYLRLAHKVKPIGLLDYFYNATIFKNLSPIVQAPFIYKCYLIWKWTMASKTPKWTKREKPNWLNDPSFIPSKEWLEEAAHNYPGAFDLTNQSIDDIITNIHEKSRIL